MCISSDQKQGFGVYHTMGGQSSLALFSFVFLLFFFDNPAWRTWSMDKHGLAGSKQVREMYSHELAVCIHIFESTCLRRAYKASFNNKYCKDGQMDGDVMVWVADACGVVGWPRMNLLYRIRRGFSIAGRCIHMP
jgi:hypothetical protein